MSNSRVVKYRRLALAEHTRKQHAYSFNLRMRPSGVSS